jgi:hypothetical protein
MLHLFNSLLFYFYSVLSSMSTTECAVTIVMASSDGSKSKCPSYTLKEKRAYIATIECLLKSGSAKRPRKACTSLGLGPKWWKKQVATQEQLKADQSTVPFNISYKCRKLHPGKPSLLDSISGQLERYIFELREQGIQVRTRAVKIEASKLSSAFRAKPDSAKKKIVERFVKRIGLTHRVGTHVAQKNHEEAINGYCYGQPVDVGINRPIKKAMTDQWEQWMYSGSGIIDRVAVGIMLVVGRR